MSALALVLVVAGCGKEEIKVYRVAKEKPGSPVAANPHAAAVTGDDRRSMPPGESAPGKPAWTVPAGWAEEPLTPMLLAKFSVTDQDARASITVSAFPGDVGGLLANVNRWRGQVSLPPINEADLAQAVKQLETQAGDASLVDLVGTDASKKNRVRLICVVLPHAGQTWFFKMMGDELVVAREKDAFLEFVQTAKFPDAP